MIKDKKKINNAINAINELIFSVWAFKDAEHRVVSQVTNSSLSFSYEFEKSGKELEKARIRLHDAIEKAKDAKDDLIFID